MELKINPDLHRLSKETFTIDETRPIHKDNLYHLIGEEVPGHGSVIAVKPRNVSDSGYPTSITLYFAVYIGKGPGPLFYKDPDSPEGVYINRDKLDYLIEQKRLLEEIKSL